MPIELADLVNAIRPENSVLFLGAGASIPSGAPSASDLALQLSKALANNEIISQDLLECASILENRYGRPSLIRKIREILSPLKPTGGLLALPRFKWHSIYTTNFDDLVEKSYQRGYKPLVPIRSNYDYGKAEASEGTPLYKIHGCVSQDQVDGSHATIVITERDYDDYTKFREALYKRLDLDLVSKNIIIIGYSLKDIHLRNQIKEAARLSNERSCVGRIYVVIFERDIDRAVLLEQLGVRVAFGSIDEFCHCLSSAQPAAVLVYEGSPGLLIDVDPRLRTSTIDVLHAQGLESSASKMFNGRPATYADIANGLTFRRTVVRPLLEVLTNGEAKFAIVTGAAGVGKTTLARQLLSQLSRKNFLCWEHDNDFPFRAGDWIAMDRQLREVERRGAIFVDECTQSLRQINILVDSLAKNENSALCVILAANLAQWTPRIKSPMIFSFGKVYTLSKLDMPEIDELLNVLDTKTEIRSLVESKFVRLSRREKRQQLRSRCDADMYVCLKNIFAFESLDMILLKEFADLPEESADIYRHVAAIESAGAKVHRQLIIRLLGIQAQTLAAILAQMQGLVEEFEISAKDGLYGWETRHIVIARAITNYKFSDQEEIYNLFHRIVDNLIPSIYVELRSIRDICDQEYGIGRLEDHDKQDVLYRRLIEIAPGERIPWHRLIRNKLMAGQLDETESLVRQAEAAVGLDGPLNRYKVRLIMERADQTAGITREDRVSLLRRGREVAARAIEFNPGDKHAYATNCELGMKIADYGGGTEALDSAIELMRTRSESILDPEMSPILQKYERQRRRFD